MSDQVLLDISCMKGIKFNIKSIYLRIAGVTWYFCFSRYKMYQNNNTNVSYTQQNIAIAIYGSTTIPVGFPLPVYKVLAITTLGIPIRQEGIHGLMPAQAHCSLQNTFASCLVFVPCVGLSHVFTLPLLVWLTQGDIYTLLMNF